MAGKRHQYRATLEWSDPQGTNKLSTHSRNHVVRIAGKPDLLVSADPGFRGDSARHNPEDLLVVSLASCHMLWYLGLCARAGIAVTHYVDEAEGTMVEDAAIGGRFERVVLHPRVTISSGDAEKAKALHKDAHRLCFVANSVNFPVECEPTIVAE
jgi:organic hydroperoxide reductase OsmC/OhrA